MFPDRTRVVTDTYDYDAFGNQIAVSGTTANVYRYRGEQWDSDLGLYYLRARYYNAGTGRFLTRDPLDASIGDIVNQHRYLYAGVDPVNGSDPSGMLAKVEYGLASQILLSVAANAVLFDLLYYEYQNPQQPELQPGLQRTNQLGWCAKCIGNMVDSLVAEAALQQSGPNQRIACHFKTQKQPCVVRHPDWPVYDVHFSGPKGTPQIAAHTMNLLLNGQPDELQYDKPDEALKAARRRIACAGQISPRPDGMSCDEYPYATTAQGGRPNTGTLVPVNEQQQQARDLKDFYLKNFNLQPYGGPSAGWFCVVVVP